MHKAITFLLLAVSLNSQDIETIDLSCIRNRVIEYNPQVASSFAYVNSIDKEGEAAYRALFPKLSLIASGFHSSERSLLTQSKSLFGTQIALLQPLFSQRIRAGINTLAAYKTHSKYLLDSLVSEMTYNAADIYLEMKMLNMQLAAAKSKASYFKEIFREVGINIQLGKSIALDGDIAEVAYIESLIEVEEYESLLSNKQNDLQVILGDISPVNIEYSQSLQEFSIEQAFNKAISANPLLLASQAVIEAERSAIKEVESEYYPTANLIVNYGATPTPFEEFPSKSVLKQNFHWGVGVEVSWQLFDSFETKAKVDAKKYTVSEKKHAYRALCDQIKSDISSEYTRFLQLKKISRVKAQSALVTQEILKKYREDYFLGTKTFFDLRQVIAESFSRDVQSKISKIQLIRSSLILKKLMGEIK